MLFGHVVNGFFHGTEHVRKLQELSAMQGWTLRLQVVFISFAIFFLITEKSCLTNGLLEGGLGLPFKFSGFHNINAVLVHILFFCFFSFFV
jgi:hypothetical protein